MQDKTRSQTEFVLEGHDKSVIVDAASYHLRDYDLTVIRFNTTDSQQLVR
jgi:hypothetical protein